jgi:hypothetical protein
MLRLPSPKHEKYVAMCLHDPLPSLAPVSARGQQPHDFELLPFSFVPLPPAFKPKHSIAWHSTAVVLAFSKDAFAASALLRSSSIFVLA